MTMKVLAGDFKTRSANGATADFHFGMFSFPDPEVDFAWLPKHVHYTMSDVDGYFDILAVLKDDDSYGAHSGCMPERVASEGSCCWRHDCAAHFTGEPGLSLPVVLRYMTAPRVGTTRVLRRHRNHQSAGPLELVGQLAAEFGEFRYQNLEVFPASRINRRFVVTNRADLSPRPLYPRPGLDRGWICSDRTWP